MWIDFSKTTLQPHLDTSYFEIFGYATGDSIKLANAVEEIKKHVKAIDIHLQSYTHLVANRITVADIAIALMIMPFYQTTLNDEFRKEVPNATKWLQTLIELPQFVSRIGEVEFMH